MQPANDSPAQSRDATRQSRRSIWIFVLLGWCVLIAVTASSVYIYQAFPAAFAVQAALTFWGPYSLATPAVLYVSRRFPLSRGRWKKHLWVHILAACAFVIICETAFAGLVSAFEPRVSAMIAERQQRGELIAPIPDPLADLKRTFGKEDPTFAQIAMRIVLFKAQFSLPLYWILVGAAHAVGVVSALREREKQAAQLEAHLTQAQLSGLRSQLQPHFLFNTLNSIAALIPQDAKLATEMVMNLSDLLRMTLRDPQRGEIRLREELSLLEHYVAIQRLRFGERLAFSVDATEEALDCHLPPLLLQPLVENAIRHGVEVSDQTEQVVVRAHLVDGQLLIEVSNSCRMAPSDEHPPSGSGVGLSNTRARLQFQYELNHYFKAEPLEGGGFLVTILIPARTSLPTPRPTPA